MAEHGTDESGKLPLFSGLGRAWKRTQLGAIKVVHALGGAGMLVHGNPKARFAAILFSALVMGLGMGGKGARNYDNNVVKPQVMKVLEASKEVFAQTQQVAREVVREEAPKGGLIVYRGEDWVSIGEEKAAPITKLESEAERLKGVLPRLPLGGYEFSEIANTQPQAARLNLLSLDAVVEKKANINQDARNIASIFSILLGFGVGGAACFMSAWGLSKLNRGDCPRLDQRRSKLEQELA